MVCCHLRQPHPTGSETEDVLRTTNDAGRTTAKTRWWRWGLLFVGLAVWPLNAQAQSWIPTDIGTLGAAQTSSAWGVSDAGMVAGQYTSGAGNQRGFSWTGGNSST